MTKREAANKNVKAEGSENKGALHCWECPFSKNGCDAEHLIPKECLRFCEKWLKDHPKEEKSEWMELSKKHIPSDFLDKKYEVELYNTEMDSWSVSNDYKNYSVGNFISFTLLGTDLEYRCRPIKEPELIIKSSGDTWVAEYNGRDYIYTDIFLKKEAPQFFCNKKKNTIDGKWKLISEIEITDKIAKMRPLILNDAGALCTLWGVFQESVIHTDEGDDYSRHDCVDNCRLATVKNLENVDG